MSLTGIDPTDPTPATRRELIFGAGLSSGGSSRDVVIFGFGLVSATNPEVTNNLNAVNGLTLVTDDADAIARFGKRSEWYSMYRKYVAVDPGANIYGFGLDVPGGGVASSCTLTFVNTATTATTLIITICGVEVSVPIAVGDTPTAIALNARLAVNGADDGKLPVTCAAPVLGVLTIVASHAHEFSVLVIGDAAPVTYGIHTRFLQPTNVTSTKAILGVAGGAIDATTAIDNVMAVPGPYYHVAPWHTASPTAADNQLGELLNGITTRALPINGEERVMVFGMVGTQSTHTAMCEALNSVRAFGFSQEGSEWTPGMIAAHNAAVIRSQQIAHPAANFAGYANTDQTIYQMVPPFTFGNRPTATEIRADLNHGACPVSVNSGGKAYLVRFITTRSLSAGSGAAAEADYRARPGHVTSVLDFTWGVIKARWLSTKQPFVSDDPAQGQKPTIKTSTPGYLKALIYNVIDDLAGNKPLGLYDGPILAPDKVAQMKAAVKTSKIAAGLVASADFFSVEHLYKGEFTLRETGEAY